MSHHCWCCGEPQDCPECGEDYGLENEILFCSECHSVGCKHCLTVLGDGDTICDRCVKPEEAK